ncbi:MAG: hypothetical protein IJT44_03520 [Clostridia bacterium]|nr:hypothetical protein [Clostridia bacterium]
MAEEWILFGAQADDPCRLKTADALTAYVDEIGFLPLFRNAIPGFSVEERTLAYDWWCGDARRDPWEWRRILASRGEVAYGKFFDGKAGFISKAWLPYFSNARRDGYDFDALWDEGKAPIRQKKIMDCFAHGEELFSHETRRTAGFGKDGEKNFEGTVTALQMQLYLVIRDFRQKVSRAGNPYGWHLAVYTMPETIWGYDLLASAYGEKPAASRERIFRHMRDVYPIASEEALRKMLG